MDCFVTPMKKKIDKLHSQWRSEQLTQMKTKIRQLNQQTSKKEYQNLRFNNLCEKLASKCTNVEAFEEMKLMYKEQRFVIKESNARKINFVLKQFLRLTGYQLKQNSTYYTNSAEKPIISSIPKDRMELMIKIFNDLLVLLTKNAFRYPQFGCFDGQDILTTLIEILKESPHQMIRTQTLKLIVFVIQNIKSKQFMLKHKLLQILAHQHFVASQKLIEQILADIFNYKGFQMTMQTLNQIQHIHQIHSEKIYSQLDLDIDSLYSLHSFVRCITQNISSTIKQSDKIVCLVLFLVQKLAPIKDIEDLSFQFLYAEIFTKLVKLLTTKNIFQKNNQKCLFKHYETIWIMYSKIVGKYEKMIKQNQDNNKIMENNQTVQNTKQNYVSIIDNFISCFIHLRAIFPQNDNLNKCLNLMLIHFYGEFQKGIMNEKLTKSQFYCLVKYKKDFTVQDCLNLISWFQVMIQNKQCRIACLKQFSVALRNSSFSEKDVFRVREIYQGKKKINPQIYDQTTQYILTSEFIPRISEIEEMEKKFNQRKIQDKANNEEKQGKMKNSNRKQG